MRGTKEESYGQRKESPMGRLQAQDLESVEAMREKFLVSYQAFRDMPGLFGKVWWSDPQRERWGALYIFRTEEDLREYLRSDRWQKKIPEKYGYSPRSSPSSTWEPSSTRGGNGGEGSWLSEPEAGG